MKGIKIYISNSFGQLRLTHSSTKFINLTSYNSKDSIFDVVDYDDDDDDDYGDVSTGAPPSLTLQSLSSCGLDYPNNSNGNIIIYQTQG